MKLFAWGLSDVGRKRDHNEDSFLINRELSLFAVADGMGGHAGGDRASHLAVEILEREVGGADLGGGTVPLGGNADVPPARELRAAARVAGRTIFDLAEGNPQLAGMGTTLTAMLFSGGRAYLAHVGDSRAYLLRAGQLVQLTEDQSLVHELVSSGQIKDEDAQRYEHNNVILQALGVTEDLVPVGGELELLRDDLILLCTDGLSSLVPRDEIQEVLAAKGDDLHAAATALTAQARVHGGHDNITVVLARFGGEELAATAGERAGAPAVTPVSIVPGTRPWHRRAGLSPVALVALAVLLMLTIAGAILLIGMD